MTTSTHGEPGDHDAGDDRAPDDEPPAEPEDPDDPAPGDGEGDDGDDPDDGDDQDPQPDDEPPDEPHEGEDPEDADDGDDQDPQPDDEPPAEPHEGEDPEDADDSDDPEDGDDQDPQPDDEPPAEPDEGEDPDVEQPADGADLRTEDADDGDDPGTDDDEDPDDEDPDDEESAEAAPLDVAPDEIFTAAVGTPEPTGAHLAGPGAALDPEPDAGAVSGTSVYPDGPPTPAPLAMPIPDPAWGTPRLPPPGGQGFERRAPRTGPQPDEHGYYPDDYYLPPNWPALFAKLTITIILVAGAVAAGLEIADRYATPSEDTAAEQTPTPVTEVPVYECAGDPDPVALLPPPGSLLIVGRTADSRWLAFRNPEAPPLQLWVDAGDVPTFVPTTVGVVSCATSPDEFPTPR